VFRLGHEERNHVLATGHTHLLLCVGENDCDDPEVPINRNFGIISIEKKRMGNKSSKNSESRKNRVGRNENIFELMEK
jgi:hypothetical protein